MSALRKTVVLSAVPLGALLCFLWAPRAALACHTVVSYGYAWTRPATLAEVGFAYADFHLGDRRGS